MFKNCHDLKDALRHGLGVLNLNGWRPRWEAGGLDWSAKRPLGAVQRARWSRLRLMGGCGSGVNRMGLSLAQRAADLGMGAVVIADGAGESSEELLGYFKARQRARFALGPGAGAGQWAGGASRISEASLLAQALDQGALAVDEWGWPERFFPSLSAAGWARCEAQLGLLEGACALARRPFLALICLESAEDAMAGALRGALCAVEASPCQARAAFAIQSHGEPDCAGLLGAGGQAREWFDARWVAEGPAEGGGEGALLGAVGRPLARQPIGRASWANEPGGRLRRCGFPEMPTPGEGARSGGELDCARALLAARESESLAGALSAGRPGGSPDGLRL